jgi:glycosyltransferase involved in cell wall biosynthesis
MTGRRIKVAYLSHFFISAAYRKKLTALAETGNVQVCGVAPTKWAADGRVDYFEAGQDQGCVVVPVRSYFHRDGTLFFFSFLSLLRILRRFRPDVVHIDEEPWSLSVLLTLAAKRLVCPHAKFIFDTSQNLVKNYPFPFNLIERLTFGATDHATAISSEAREVLLRKGLKCPVCVVGHAVDTTIFKRMEKPEVRRALSLPDGFLVGFVGILTERKGVLDLLEGFALLGAPEAKLILVGGGSLEGTLREKLRSDSRLGERVLMTGPVPHHEIVSYLNALDVLVLPSRTTPYWKEQFGRILIETMACGVPVIGSNSGGIPEVIDAAGLVFREGDVTDLASQLRALYDSPELRRDLAEKGLQRVREEYTWLKVASTLADIYATTQQGQEP